MIVYPMEELYPAMMVIAITLLALLQWGIRATIKPKILGPQKNAIKNGVNNKRRKVLSAMQVN